MTILQQLGVDVSRGGLASYNPADNAVLGHAPVDDAAAVQKKIQRAEQAYHAWRNIPAPKRGELVRLLGESLRTHKQALGELVTQECGKILSEGLGEVQEMIDICDFAVGLSRQLYGKKIASERAEHDMEENYRPLGVVGIISAFNFPVAVWMWNAALALVCGNSIVWKPSEKTPLVALACQALYEEVAKQYGAPEGLSEVIIGQADVGDMLVKHPAVRLISATGSSRMGRAVKRALADDLGKKLLLELGGNNAVIVTPSASIEMAVKSTCFGAFGTAGQRCTSTRRLFVHKDVYPTVTQSLTKAYESIIATKIGNPLEVNTLVGPLIDAQAVKGFEHAVAQAVKQGGTMLAGGKTVAGNFVQPTLIAMPSQTDIVQEETFAPILYVMEYTDLAAVMQVHNAVPQGLSSAIFTNDVREAAYFKQHSDCGIANVNIGTSGAEIGGLFGGEKDTGGGRESGSDAWKSYMYPQTSTTNFGNALPLAQGVKFDL